MLVEFSFVFFLVEEPWVSLDVFVNGSGHSSRVDIGMPLRVYDGILQLDVPDRESVNKIN